MIIDDEVFDQRIYKRTISRSGLVDELLSFYAADHAIEHLRTHQDLVVDAIFLDINMPRMNGFEFLRALEERTVEDIQAVIILMITVSLTRTDSLRAAKSPLIQDCFSKPFRADYIEPAADLVSRKRALTMPPLVRRIAGGGGGAPANRMPPASFPAA